MSHNVLAFIIAWIVAVSLEKYMKENFSKIKDDEEIKQLEKMFK